MEQPKQVELSATQNGLVKQNNARELALKSRNREREKETSGSTVRDSHMIALHLPPVISAMREDMKEGRKQSEVIIIVKVIQIVFLSHKTCHVKQ